MSRKRPVGLVVVVVYKSFVASLMAMTAITLFLTQKNHQSLEQFSESYLLESKHLAIGWILDKILSFSPKTLQFSELAAALYAGITAVEAVGLWHERIWAEILVIVLVSISIPFEVLELVRRITILKLIVFFVNLGVLLYLIHHFYKSKIQRYQKK